MRTVSLWALALLALTALIGNLAWNSPCQGPYCQNSLVWLALAVLLGPIGFGLALSAAIQGVVRTMKRRQLGWCVGLVVGVLVPLPAGILLSFGSTDPLQDLLPLTAAGLLLTPVVALIYSLRYPRGVAERSSSPVPLPAAETLGETAPPPLDAS